ncbi:pyridoxamine 5'-phosphate oxidase family protein [Aquimarina algiphila]|uniref:pyridoxamine 5'-phosphate oxidase family protein n=1 Tax=Aquimarina algiphila TaxID=2047982 RepID=UPI00232B1BC7|nr:pyridoxamine 5'-phosphate oxidase family protein [Aquimarina algiphila]
MSTYFHKGELELQKKYDAWHDPKLVERLLKDSIVSTLIPFIEHQTTLILSTYDDDNIWASMLIGDTGFVKVKTSKLVHIDLSKVKSTKTDIGFKNIKKHSKVGLLFIDTSTRTRYRLNGFAHLSKELLSIEVLEAYPNCPKYIQQRVITLSEDTSGLGIEVVKGMTLLDHHKEWIKEADTFFLGSMNTDGDMDASHRGGHSGFVDILKNGTLKIPDYTGNNLFNTLGNFLEYPKAGLLFIDYEKGHSLQLSGNVELLLDQETSSDIEKTTGTGRYWLFKTKHWIQTQNHNKVDWKFINFSPFNP